MLQFLDGEANRPSDHHDEGAGRHDEPHWLLLVLNVTIACGEDVEMWLKEGERRLRSICQRQRINLAYTTVGGASGYFHRSGYGTETTPIIFQSAVMF